jgi:hypothetical protein
MQKYIYLDNSQGKYIPTPSGVQFIAPIVLEVVAYSIESADSIFQKEKGKHPRFMPFIACKIEKFDLTKNEK